MSIFRRRFGTFLAMLTVAAVAFAAPIPLPRNGPIYKCDAGGWKTVQFKLERFNPNLYRGEIRINGDNKKADLAFDPAKNPRGWEFVMPLDNLSCRDLKVFRRGRILDFQQCSDGVGRICYF